MNNIFNISDNLYEVHCMKCDEVLLILETNEKNPQHPCFCEACGIIENNNRLQEQNS